MEACNVFYYLTYSGSVNRDVIMDEGSNTPYTPYPFNLNAPIKSPSQHIRSTHSLYILSTHHVTICNNKLTNPPYQHSQLTPSLIPTLLFLIHYIHEGLRRATELQIAHFGQIPMQLFRHPHPAKRTPSSPLFHLHYPGNSVRFVFVRR